MSAEYIPAELRKLVEKRAFYCCEYCQSQVQFSTQSFSVEHIIPISKAGKTLSENLALACQGCNGHKHVKIEGYDPISKTVVPLYNPRQQKWQEHFNWSDDFTLILGLTPTGRATLEALKLNRDGVVNLRWALHELGKHPPKQTAN